MSGGYNRTNSSISIDATLKRIAWSYGCAKKGSDIEADLRLLLIAKATAEPAPPTPPRLFCPYCREKHRLWSEIDACGIQRAKDRTAEEGAAE